MLIFGLIIIIIILALLTYLGLNQDRMIFFPEKLHKAHQYQFPFRFTELNIETERGIILNAIHAKCNNPKGLVFYLHGNAGNLDSWADTARSFLAFGYDVFIYDYRGYGKSTGSISSQASLVGDAEFLFNQIKSHYEMDSIVIYGRSIGTGIAAILAQKMGLKALVLETPYKSFVKLVQHYYFFVPPVFIKYKLRTEENLKTVVCPIYIIHGTHDEIIPFNHSENLKHSQPRIKFFKVNGGHHNDLEIYPEYQLMLMEVFGSN